jgi:hypothetical protein
MNKENTWHKYYRFMSAEDFEQVALNKELIRKGEGIYVCDTLEDVLQFINYRVPVLKQDDSGNIIEQIYTKNEDIRIIEFLADSDKFEESFDHNAEVMNGAKAFVSKEDRLKIIIINVYTVE